MFEYSTVHSRLLVYKFVKRVSLNREALRFYIKHSAQDKSLIRRTVKFICETRVLKEAHSSNCVLSFNRDREPSGSLPSCVLNIGCWLLAISFFAHSCEPPAPAYHVYSSHCHRSCGAALSLRRRCLEAEAEDAPARIPLLRVE